ncbi:MULTISPECIES: rhodanese-like domain-containing protein [Pseudomonas]|uniref:rhodanese-like domain-containing protein n=1 Tax=unclassified Pseudomonas TaxID=196821 RepID=UPI0025F00FBB|nr:MULTISPECIES: rhodanese-like domain-containing protein [unclassified Pseudomonas]
MVEKLLQFASENLLLVTVFVVLLVLLLLNELRRGGKSLSTGQLTALVNADKAVVIDVRTNKEYAGGHIVGAVNIPHDKLLGRTAELEKHKGKTLILVDAMGQQAGTLCRELLKSGFDAARLSGGVSSWKADNLPLVK